MPECKIMKIHVHFIATLHMRTHHKIHICNNQCCYCALLANNNSNTFKYDKFYIWKLLLISSSSPSSSAASYSNINVHHSQIKIAQTTSKGQENNQTIKKKNITKIQTTTHKYICEKGKACKLAHLSKFLIRKTTTKKKIPKTRSTYNYIIYNV